MHPMKVCLLQNLVAVQVSVATRSVCVCVALFNLILSTYRVVVIAVTWKDNNNFESTVINGRLAAVFKDNSVQNYDDDKHYALSMILSYKYSAVYSIKKDHHAE